MDNNWTDKVKTKWTPPQGLFKSSSINIARTLYDNSKDKRQAIARLNFYKNRSGKNLSNEDLDRLELARKKLIKMYEYNEINHSIINNIYNFSIVNKAKDKILGFIPSTINKIKSGSDAADNKEFLKLVNKGYPADKIAKKLDRKRALRKIRVGVAVPILMAPIPGSAPIATAMLAPEMLAKNNGKNYLTPYKDKESGNDKNFSSDLIRSRILNRAKALVKKGYNIDCIGEMIDDDDFNSEYITRLLHKNLHIFKK